MLFSGGMGVGLVFWSAAEPMWHYASNPFTPGLSDESASMAMQLTFPLGFASMGYILYHRFSSCLFLLS